MTQSGFHRFLHRHKIKFILPLALMAVFGGLVMIFLPRPLFDTPVCLVVEDAEGQLLGAAIAADGQWRFPAPQGLPGKFKQALVCFEDKRFYRHPGIDPLALGRAMRQNLKARKIQSGGSTLTMQVARLARRQDRNVFQKTIEMLLAVYLEMAYTKDEILELYAWQAPFGGNVVGLDAAAWRYFGRDAQHLTWGEAALLAVLPNSPSLLHPGKNQAVLKAKRDRLLERMRDEGIFDSLTCLISKAEPLPGKPFPMPAFAPHLLDRIRAEEKQSTPAVVSTTLKAGLQAQALGILQRYAPAWEANGIHNAAAIIVEVETGHVLAYIGNLPAINQVFHHNEVDVIRAARSPGSLLKPLLYTSALTGGHLMPGRLIADIPTHIAGYSPRNFDLGYDGAVPADKALARSLNVPAVHLLREYGYGRFHFMLRRMGFTTLTQPADHYGLSLILGGCETSLWELTGVYASMARILNQYATNSSRYDPSAWFMPSYTERRPADVTSNKLPEDFFVEAGALRCMFDAMEEVMRPGEEGLWKSLDIRRRIAWKTGTSFGFRDAWAIGCTPAYVVGVWVGNADGEGRPGLTGISSAAPALFDIFRLLPEGPWFEMPYDDMAAVPVCRHSGYRASVNCQPVDTLRVPIACLKTPPCPYHRLVHLDHSGQWRVHSDCEDPAAMQHVTWFVLPPAMEFYYRKRNIAYQSLPAWRPDCLSGKSPEQPIAMIYPENHTRILIPVEIDGTPGKTVFEAAHRRPLATLFWHLDGVYLGSTREFHKMALRPSSGKHRLTLVDDEGETITVAFEVAGQ